MQYDPTPRRPSLDNAGERLLLVALRTWGRARAEGCSAHPVILQAMPKSPSRHICALLTAWLQAVEAGTSRPVQLHCPGCGGASMDEQRLIAACGVSPVALELGEHILEPLINDARQLMVISRALNGALAAEGLNLPVRLDFGPPEPLTLH